MSAVGVLAVMDADAAHADAYRIVYGVIDATPQEMAAGSAEARAAVAELIEATETILNPHTSVSVNAQYERLRTALARCKGGAA